MADKKPKSILVVNGVLHGHFTGSVEIVRELVLLGHNVTCLVSDEFSDRIKDTGAKIIVYNVDKNELKKQIPPGVPPISINVLILSRSYDKVITFLLKEGDKYDYYVFDSFFDVKEMNKILKFSLEKYVLIYTAFVFSDEDLSDFTPQRKKALKYIDEKYHLDLHEMVEVHYIPNKFHKLILTSKYFHLRGENTDETCHFIGPNIEKRKKDENFTFKKDGNKKLIYISLGTIFNQDKYFFKKCLDAFRDSEEYQVVMSIGESNNIKECMNLDIPKNFSIYNYIPQTQLLNYVDIFITHGGLNSIQEGLLSGIPLIVIPQKYDQFDNARRVDKLKAGIFLDKNKINITTDVLKDTVNKIINNKEKYKEGVAKVNESFKEDRNNRKNIYEKVFI